MSTKTNQSGGGMKEKTRHVQRVSTNTNTDQRKKAQEGGDEGRESNDSWTMVRTYFVFVG